VYPILFQLFIYDHSRGPDDNLRDIVEVPCGDGKIILKVLLAHCGNKVENLVAVEGEKPWAEIVRVEGPQTVCRFPVQLATPPRKRKARACAMATTGPIDLLDFINFPEPA
jgi:hypothetical protein